MWRARIPLLFSMLGVFSMDARAQDVAAFDVQRFEALPQGGTFTLVRDATLRPGGRIWTQAVASYGLAPVAGDDADVIRHLAGLDLQVEIAATDWLSVGFGLPVGTWSLDIDEQVALAYGREEGAWAAGDLEVHVAGAPLQQVRGHPVDLLIVAALQAPTGNARRWTGSGTGLTGELALGRLWPFLRVSLSAAYRWRASPPGATWVLTDDEVRWGLGAAARISEGLAEVGVEWTGAVAIPGAVARGGPLGEPRNRLMSELLFTGRVLPRKAPVSVLLGVGPGLTSALGVPGVRAFLGVGFHTDFRKPITLPPAAP